MKKTAIIVIGIIVVLGVVFAILKSNEKVYHRDENGNPIGENSESLEFSQLPDVALDPKTEIDKWKKELIDRKKLGGAGDYSEENFPTAKKEQWIKDYPNQQYGLPMDDSKITSTKADLDGDGKADLLLYFRANKVTVMNGNTPSFAKVVYANGSSNSNIMKEIQEKILAKYNESRKNAVEFDAKGKKFNFKDFKEITNNYLDETTTFEFKDNQMKGEFYLFTKTDAHCCASYDGTYTYNPKDKKINIQIVSWK